jgi:hypothetical protein
MTPARDLADPPELAPDVLWRSLLPFRPERLILPRLRGAPHIPLSVRAVPAMLEQRARDVGHLAAGDVPELQHPCAAREVLALVLHVPQGRAFASAAALGRLEQPELAELTRATLEALADICPTYGRSNPRRWREALTAGAKHGSNLNEALTLAACVDVTLGGLVPRPDRYWGCPFHELLDGHWLAYQAARDAVKK